MLTTKNNRFKKYAMIFIIMQLYFIWLKTQSVPFKICMFRLKKFGTIL